MYRENKYTRLYLPKHPKADSTGQVYEHIIKAEEYIGRPLKKGEVVHHEDRVRYNNSKNNLYVFVDDANHSRYHKTGIKLQNSDGSWYAPEQAKQEKRCQHCKEVFLTLDGEAKYCSKVCKGVYERVTDRPSKENLYELLKTKTFVEVGKIYTVSDNTIRKWCRYYKIPDKAKYYRNIK